METGSPNASGPTTARSGPVLEVTPELLDLGLGTAVLVARGLDNGRNPPELIAYRRQLARELAAYWKNRSITAHPAIREYHRVHARFGADDEPASPERLITFVRRRRDLTGANAVVDCYNLVSARTLLSIGAHDLEKLRTPITLRRLEDGDRFRPLGESDARTCDGEYGYVDPAGRVICRMETLQCDETKVEPHSKDVVFFLQANAALTSTDLLHGTWLLAEMVEELLGGRCELAGFENGGAAGDG